jgi:hypothetical protein
MALHDLGGGGSSCVTISVLAISVTEIWSLCKVMFAHARLYLKEIRLSIRCCVDGLSHQIFLCPIWKLLLHSLERTFCPTYEDEIFPPGIACTNIISTRSKFRSPIYLGLTNTLSGGDHRSGMCRTPMSP